MRKVELRTSLRGSALDFVNEVKLINRKAIIPSKGPRDSTLKICSCFFNVAKKRR